MLASSVIVLEGMRKSCVQISFAPLPFDCLSAKESQDFLMPRVASLQQIDLHPGTAYSLQVSWREERGFVGRGFWEWNLSDDLSSCSPTLKKYWKKDCSTTKSHFTKWIHVLPRLELVLVLWRKLQIFCQIINYTQFQWTFSLHFLWKLNEFVSLYSWCLGILVAFGYCLLKKKTKRNNDWSEIIPKIVPNSNLHTTQKPHHAFLPSVIKHYSSEEVQEQCILCTCVSRQKLHKRKLVLWQPWHPMKLISLHLSICFSAENIVLNGLSVPKSLFKIINVLDFFKWYPQSLYVAPALYYVRIIVRTLHFLSSWAIATKNALYIAPTSRRRRRPNFIWHKTYFK